MATTKQSSTTPIPNKYSANSMMVVKLANNKPPLFVEKQGKDWVYFGTKNEYPQYLLSLFNQSAKHNAIVFQKNYYITGAGYEGEIGLKEVNPEGETLNEITQKSGLDFEIFGGYCLEVIWNKGGKGLTFRHIDFSKIRSNKDNTEFYYTKNWTKINDFGGYNINQNPQNEEDWEIYQPFDGLNKKGKQLFYYKSYRPGLEVYPLPEYLGAISYIELDYQIANYWYNAVKYGFAPSHIINFFNGIPTEEEKRRLEKEIKNKFTGTENAGKFILNFSDSKETGGSDIQNITPQDLDKQFNILNATIQEEIFSGHRITSPMLMGIKTPGQLGGRTELIDANELFQNIYVKPKQYLIESAFGYIMGFNGIKELKLNAIDPIGLDLISSPEAWNILTDVEKREEIGREPLPQQESIQQNQMLTLINSVNPKVGEKILESLTINEIRAIAGLETIVNGDIIAGTQINNPPQVNTTTPVILPKPNLPTPMASLKPTGFPIPSNMGDCIKKLMDEGKSKEQALAICISNNEKMSSENVIELFKKYGKKGNGKKLAYRNLGESKFGTLEDSEKEYIQKFTDPILRAFELSVLDLLNKDNLMTPEAIAKILKSNSSKVQDAINNLKDKNLVEQSSVKSGESNIIQLTPIKDAQNILNNNDVPTEQIYIKYSYGWAPGFNDSDLKTSRDFCVKLRGLSNSGIMWSREDIESISSESGWNVWEMRGGWYTKPDTAIHVPHCRHRWIQNIIHEAK